MANIVAIVGRPNVGKSTLFNRLTESRKAIVDDFSGVTRDRHYGTSEWINKDFTVVDTGGYVKGDEDAIESGVRNQVRSEERRVGKEGRAGRDGAEDRRRGWDV